MDTKTKTYSSTRGWKNKTKNKKNENTGEGGERTSPKPKKANNFGRVPQQIISSSANAVEGGMFIRYTLKSWASPKADTLKSYKYLVNYCILGLEISKHSPWHTSAYAGPNNLRIRRDVA